jgi:hypothetical protein
MSRGGSRYGAGRPGWHGKTENHRAIDVRRFQREDMLRPGWWSWQWSNAETGEVLASIGISGGIGEVTLQYSTDGHSVNEHITITRTACNYGGSRPWFQCPKCRGRVARLYLRGGRFACRSCKGLVYASQSEDVMGRSWLKQQKLEARLGENWRRPKGMHRKTREAILAKVWACEEVRDDALAAYCERVGFKLRG